MASYTDHLPVFTGEVRPEHVNQVFDVLVKDLPSCGSNEDSLKSFVKKQGEATVTSRVSGEEVVVPSRRQCKRWTFGEELVSRLDDIVLKSVAAMSTLGPPDFDVVNVKSHGDVLVYEEGDFFREHRDTIEDKPPLVCPEDYFHYTLLLALYDTEEGGETGIITPMEGVQKKVLYTETTSKGRFLLFPSEQMHFGNEIKSGTKMILKMDYWINIPICEGFKIPTLDADGKVSQESYDELYRSLDYYERYDYYPSEEDDSWCNGYHLSDWY